MQHTFFLSPRHLSSRGFQQLCNHPCSYSFQPQHPLIHWFSSSLLVFPQLATFSKQLSCLFQAVITGFPPVRWFSPSSLPFPNSLPVFTRFHWFFPSSLPFPSSSLRIFLWFAGFPPAHPSFIVTPSFYIITYILQCIHSVVMALKLDHIPTLDGVADYPSWSKSIM